MRFRTDLLCLVEIGGFSPRKLFMRSPALPAVKSKGVRFMVATVDSRATKPPPHFMDPRLQEGFKREPWF